MAVEDTTNKEKVVLVHAVYFHVKHLYEQKRKTSLICIKFSI